MRFGRRAHAIVVALGLLTGACASAPRAPSPPAGPRYPDYPMPAVPASLAVAADVRARHEAAWARLQAGDLRGARRGFEEVLRRSRGFYPAEAGLGFVLLAERRLGDAARRFTAAVNAAADYLPAWIGQAETQLALGDDDQALAALERVVALDPDLAEARRRLELLRFRRLQGLLEAARRDRDAGRWTEAQQHLERAETLSPASPLIHRELAMVATGRGEMGEAEARARKALALDAGDAESLAALGAALEGQDRFAEAAEAYLRAHAAEPRAVWLERGGRLLERASLEALPADYRTIPTAPTLTRAQVAAYLGVQLDRLLAGAPRKAAVVATDVRGHWAAKWIIPVTQVGVMDVQPNHTFQPSATVLRADLAGMVVRLLGLIAPRPAELSACLAARPRLADLPPGHLSYPAAAVAVACGAMSAHNSRFDALRPATGPELVAAVQRIEQIATR